MSFHALLYLISTVITLLVAGLIGYLISRSKFSKSIKVVAFIIILVVSFFVWNLVGLLLYSPMANAVPQKSDVPCFTLNKYNCEKRVDCRPDNLPGGLGNDSFYCAREK